jgi:integrase
MFQARQHDVQSLSNFRNDVITVPRSSRRPVGSGGDGLVLPFPWCMFQPPTVEETFQTRAEKPYPMVIALRLTIPQGSPIGRLCEAYTLPDIFQHLNLLNGKPQAKAIVALVAFAGLRKGELRGLMSTDDLGENVAVHRSAWQNVVKEQCKTTSSGTELAPAMIPVIAPLRAILDAIKPFKSGRMFSNRCGGVLDLDNFATRVIKPRLKKAGSLWYGWQAYRRGLVSNLKALGTEDMVIQRVLRRGREHDAAQLHPRAG